MWPSKGVGGEDFTEPISLRSPIGGGALLLGRRWEGDALSTGGRQEEAEKRNLCGTGSGKRFPPESVRAVSVLRAFPHAQRLSVLSRRSPVHASHVLGGWYHHRHHLHFTNEGSKAQRSKETCPRPHSK